MKIRLIIYAILIITIFGCHNSNNIKNDLEKSNLNDKVKSLRENQFMITHKFGEIKKTYRIKDDECFSLYNKEGNLYCSYQYNEDGKVSRISVLNYDEASRITEENYLTEDSVLYDKETYEYDIDGNMILGLDFDKHGSIEDKVICIYENSILVEYNSYDKDNLLYSKSKYTNDSKGNITEEMVYNSDGSLNKKLEYKYDNRNNLVDKSYHRYSDNRSRRTSFKYDENSHLIEELFYNSDNSFSGSNKYKYDSFGNIVLREFYNSDNVMFMNKLNKFEYDHNNNWISKIIFENDKPYFICEREIDYY